MALYRVTVIFNGAKHGWSESHVFNRTGTTPGAFAATLVPLLAARADLLGRQYQIDGARVSKIRNDDGSKVKRNVFPLLQVFKPTLQTALNDADPAPVAVIAKGTTVDGNRSKNVFLGGIPDDVDITAGEIDASKVNFGPHFVTWNSQMIAAGAGWLGFEVDKELGITDYVSTPDNIITFTLNGGTFAAGVIGKQMVVRCRQINNSKSVLNTSLLVYVIDATHCQTVRRIAAGDYLNGGIMTTYTQPSTFFTSAGWGAVKIGNHKRGRPLLVSAGRAQARARV